MKTERENQPGRTARLPRPGDIPPDFGFGDESTYHTLSQMKGARRVLLAFCPDSTSSPCRDKMRAVRDEWSEFHQRDMLVIVISPNKEDVLIKLADTERAPIILISDEKRQTAASYGVRGMNNPVVYLIGKDGSVKATWTRWPSNQEVFELVDSMPMRRKEMWERKAA